MKKFTFSLESVLNFRATKVREVQREVQEAELEVRRVDESIQALRAESDEVRHGLQRSQETGHSVEDLAAAYAYIEALGERVASQQDDRMRLMNVLATKRQKLMRVRQEHKAIERLKEKQFQEWKEELQRKESAFIDEIATQRFGRDN